MIRYVMSLLSKAKWFFCLFFNWLNRKSDLVMKEMRLSSIILNLMIEKKNIHSRSSNNNNELISHLFDTDEERERISSCLLNVIWSLFQFRSSSKNPIINDDLDFIEKNKSIDNEKVFSKLLLPIDRTDICVYNWFLIFYLRRYISIGYFFLSLSLLLSTSCQCNRTECLIYFI